MDAPAGGIAARPIPQAWLPPQKSRSSPELPWLLKVAPT